jgi:GTPase SAR1 family protein
METPIITGKFNLALQLVNQTGCNIFLTGKAGSGKTTFLKYIKQHTHKQTVVVAPTGVAAINAGGVTIHSFFQLSFLPYLASKRFFGSSNVNYIDKHQLLKGTKIGKEKTNIIKKLELLIIDEASMVRADTLDAIDDVLKYIRRNQEPFGGVQVLLIGDLFQLPPVLVDHEARLISEYYESPFFFSANIVKNTQLVSVELDKIFRQTDEDYISIQCKK